MSGFSSVSCNPFAFPSLLGCERPPDGGPLASCFSGDSRCVSSEAFFGPPSRFTCSCFTAPRGYGSTSTYVCACVRKYFLLLSPAQLYGESSLESKLRPHALLFSSPLRLLLVCRGPSPYLRTYVRRYFLYALTLLSFSGAGEVYAHALGWVGVPVAGPSRGVLALALNGSMGSVRACGGWGRAGRIRRPEELPGGSWAACPPLQLSHTIE